MRRIVSILVVLSLSSFGAILSRNAETTRQAIGPLEGVVTLDQLNKYANLRWEPFEPEDPDGWNESVQGIRMAKAGARLEVFFGTWCHDSEREIPRLVKLLDDLEISADDRSDSGRGVPFRVRWVALDEKKQNPAEEIKAYRVTHTPTLILVRGHSEVGRIVERPARSLEVDLQRLLEGTARGIVSASEGAIRDYLRPPTRDSEANATAATEKSIVSTRSATPIPPPRLEF